MRKLYISTRDGDVSLLSDEQDCKPDSFWGQWNSPLTETYWCRTEVDLDGEPYTVKWTSNSFVNITKVQIGVTTALIADGAHPANTLPPSTPRPIASAVPSTQAGRQRSGTRISNPLGTWTVVRSWYVYIKEQDRERCKYLLLHEDGHEEEWWSFDMADADFHVIQAPEQQTLDSA